MRQLPLPLLFIAALVSVFMACKKEATLGSAELGVAKDSISGGDARPDGRECMGRVRLECGMLSFADQDHYQLVYDCLEAAYEAHLDAFEAQYGYLSEDDYNDMADQLGFVDEQPLIDFEASVGLYSYRAQREDIEEQVLAGGGDPESFGDNPFEDDVAEAMMNKHGAVMVGGRIHVFLPNGDVYSFCSCDKYELFLIDPSLIDPNDECVLINKSTTPYCSDSAPPCYCCNGYGKEKGGIPYDSDSKKVTWTLFFRYQGTQWWVLQGGTRATAKLRNWKWNGVRWRARRARMLSSSFGLYRDVLCKDGGTEYITTKCRRRKTISATYRMSNVGDPRRTFRTGEPVGKWQFAFESNDCEANSYTYQHALQFDPCVSSP